MKPSRSAAFQECLELLQQEVRKNVYNFAGIREESLPVTAQIEERLLTALCPQLFCLLLDMFL